MPIVKVQCENPDELLNASMLGAGALIRIERAASEAGAYSEITTAAIVAGTRLYTVYDAAGAETSWYRVRYSKSDGSSPSGYGPVFPAGDETAGLICSLYDVQQRMFGTATVSNSDTEVILDIIREVTAEIEGYCERDFTGASADVTFQVHTQSGRILRLPRGIQSVTTLGIATQDQPSTGGTYTTTTSFYLDPPLYERSTGWPATSICLLSGASFYDAAFGAQIVGRPGWASVPYDIQGVAIGAVTRRFWGKARAEPQAFLGPTGDVRILRDIGPDGTRVLTHYRSIPV